MASWNCVAAVVMLASGLTLPADVPVGDAATAPHAGSRASTGRAVTIVARRYAFDPASIDVQVGETVQITLVAEDIPHSFTIDEYRICKRATPDRSVTFEFLADQPGRFPFYCDLKAEEGCQAMRGTLVVRVQ